MLIHFKEFSGKNLHCPTINLHYAAMSCFPPYDNGCVFCKPNVVCGLLIGIHIKEAKSFFGGRGRGNIFNDF